MASLKANKVQPPKKSVEPTITVGHGPACMPWIVSEAGMLGFFYSRRHPAAAGGGGYGIKDILRVQQQQQQPEGGRVPGGT